MGTASCCQWNNRDDFAALSKEIKYLLIILILNRDSNGDSICNSGAKTLMKIDTQNKTSFYNFTVIPENTTEKKQKIK